MADTAAHLVDRVLPPVPVRQWVLTLPYPLRYRCAYDAKLTSEVLRAFLRSLFAELRRRIRRHFCVRAEQCGAVTVLQCFGSALNLNLHFHTLALDGAYPYAPRAGQPLRFLPLPPPTRDDVARVLAGTARRLHRLLAQRGDEDDDPLARDEPLLALLAAVEWTSALTRWCDTQPEMIAFTRICRVQRAEILRLQGSWSDAMAEASRACEAHAPGEEYSRPPPEGLYQQAEIHRLRGDLQAAEEAYRAASLAGREPQPGLALLRLMQGKVGTARKSIRRALASIPDRLGRARLLPAYVEIALAAGRSPEAREASAELEEIHRVTESEVLEAAAAQTRGWVALEAGQARDAMPSLREAFEIWRRIDMPYEAARVRVLLARACRALGDEEAAELELVAAQAELDTLGAAPDIERVDALLGRSGSGERRELTPRELEVLRCVATGKTNKAIARELSVSERTIDRHVSNILTKLDVPSRAAATAAGYERGLL